MSGDQMVGFAFIFGMVAATFVPDWIRSLIHFIKTRKEV